MPQLSLLPLSTSSARRLAMPSASVTEAVRVRTVGGSKSFDTRLEIGLSWLRRFSAVTP